MCVWVNVCSYTACNNVSKKVTWTYEPYLIINNNTYILGENCIPLTGSWNDLLLKMDGKIYRLILTFMHNWRLHFFIFGSVKLGMLHQLNGNWWEHATETARHRFLIGIFYTRSKYNYSQTCLIRSFWETQFYFVKTNMLFFSEILYARVNKQQIFYVL